MGEDIRGDKETPLLVTTIRDGSGVEKYLPSLRRLLQHCVNDEPSMSSIGFLGPLLDNTAIDYWLQLFPTAVGPNPTTSLLVVTDSNDPTDVIATVQIARNPRETHAYKGEIRKLLVHPAHRRNGLGKRLMHAAEKVAKEDIGLEMLVLDTATETPARDFYARTGWTEWGICPGYAKFADGRKARCSFFVKML
ncbi:acyl-CoA N-acyltransferase [Ilyonectria destructans]|nr:acyl-CoA N-acyltransferase [Ilyonectria destructans]